MNADIKDADFLLVISKHIEYISTTEIDAKIEELKPTLQAVEIPTGKELNNSPIDVYKGYPEGWGMPLVIIADKKSPESPPKTEGERL